VQADLDRTLKGAAEPTTEADLAEYGGAFRPKPPLPYKTGPPHSSKTGKA
jgi:hypothetical protein